MDIIGFVGGWIIRMALSWPLLLFGWIIVLILQYSWSGMYKFLSLLFFPGLLVHMASHYLFAKIFRLRVYEILRLDIASEGSSSGIILSSDIYKKQSHKIYITLLSPMIVSLLFVLALQKLLIYVLYTANIRLAILIAWLIIGIFTFGMPSMEDLKFIFIFHIMKNPETIIGLLWGIVVYALGYISYGPNIASLGLLIYIILILLASFIPHHEELMIIE